MTADRNSGGADWRAFEDAPLVVGAGIATSDLDLPKRYRYIEALGTWPLSENVIVQTLTVAEHEGHPGQHIITRRSGNGGRTWTAWEAVEPEGPPMSQYGGVVQHPTTGRACFLYALGPEKTVPHLPDGRAYDGPVHTHHIARVACRHVHPDGAMDARRVFLDLPRTAIDRANIYGGAHTFFYTRPEPRMLRANDGLGWYTKLGPRPLVSEGEAFLVVFEDWANNDRLEALRLRLLPEGDHGIRDPHSSCVAEFGPIRVDGRNLFFKYRTTAGYAGLATSGDGGNTFSTGPMRYAHDDRPVKNPQGPLTTFRDDDGRLWLSWYNLGFRDAEHPEGIHFDGRDLVFLAPVRIRGPELRVGQPELVGYRRDQQGWTGDLRMNCLRFTERDGDAWLGRISDKRSVRTMRVPAAFLDIVAGQFEACATPCDGLAYVLSPGRDNRQTADAPPLQASRGFTILLDLAAPAVPGVVLLDATDAVGAGVRIATNTDGTITLCMTDGTRRLELTSDDDADAAVPPQHIGVAVDGRARLVGMVIDGRLQDGGARRLRGVARFASDHDVRCDAGTVSAHAAVETLRLYDRCLLTSEIVGAWRAFAANRTDTSKG